MVSKAKPKSYANSLHLIAPSNLRLKDLYEDGLLIPGKMNDKEAIVPLDFTSISSREVGKQHSYWAVRHAHLLFLVGNLRAEIGNLKHDLKNAEAQWVIKQGDKYRTKWKMDAAVSRSKRIRRLRGHLVRAEASLARYEALSESYRALREAASREMSRRSTEVGSKD
jgi:hypothetical protein